MITIDLSGQTVVVTGGKSGIGAGIVELFLTSGATVISADIAYPETYHSVDSHLIEAHLNIASSEDINRFFEVVLQQAGIPDVVVNCAGISTMDYVIDSKLEDWNKVFAINSTGLYWISKLFAEAMVRGNKAGRIIQIASQAGKNGYRAMGGYCASKHAVLGLTKVMGVELAKHNVLVNAVCPGIVETPMKHRERVEGGVIRGMTAQEIYEEDCSQIPLGRTAEVSDVANVVLFLASPLSSYMTGQAINVTGGMTMN